MATGWPMKTTYADGDVYSASDVNDITGTINLLQTSTLSRSAGKNAVINGGMDIWQRGTSFSNVNGYSVDRWYVNRNGAVSGCTASQSTDAPSRFQYSLKTQRVAGNTGTQSIDIYYGAESKDSYVFQSQLATLSFYAKVGANYSGGASGLTARILSGTATDASPFSGSTTVATLSPTLTTTWTRFTVTGTFGASITQAFVQIGWSPTGTAGADDSVYITGVQLELGSYATTFSRAGGTIQGELAACQRYYETGTAYQNIRNPSIADNNPFGALSGTHFQVAKRGSTTISLGTATTTLCYTNSGGTYNITNSGFTQILLVLTGGAVSNMTITQPWTASAEL